jgi:hypothetical protein
VHLALLLEFFHLIFLISHRFDSEFHVAHSHLLEVYFFPLVNFLFSAYIYLNPKIATIFSLILSLSDSVLLITFSDSKGLGLNFKEGQQIFFPMMNTINFRGFGAISHPFFTH